LIEYNAGYADPAGFSDTFKSGCHVDAIAKEIVALDDDVTKMDANPKAECRILR